MRVVRSMRLLHHTEKDDDVVKFLKDASSLKKRYRINQQTNKFRKILPGTELTPKKDKPVSNKG